MLSKYRISTTLYSANTFLLLGIGISLQIKAGIGQSMFNAFCMLFADLCRIEIGTMINFFNLLFFVVYLLMKPSHLKLQDFMLIIATVINGFIINLFTYSIFSHIIIQSYQLRVLTFMLGLTLASISLGAILAIGVIKFPLESLCLVLSQKLKWSLTKVRMGFDIFFLANTFIFTYITDHTLYIREGTVISFLLLSRLMGLSYDFYKKQLIKGDTNYV